MFGLRSFEFYEDDCLAVMRQMPDGIIDAVVTDPPYGLAFMGRDWDHGVPGVPFWSEALRVLKPGGHLVAFGGTRTYHRLACAIEDAGFEIRDCLSWLYGSGFPKSHNGHWGGTALKPAWEPIILARKPIVGTVAANVQAHGTGALNVDGCRLKHRSEADRISATPQGRVTGKSGALAGKVQHDGARSEFQRPDTSLGRWPANVVLDEEAARLLDEQSSGTSRFFYIAKASSRERHSAGKNTHPTVKPVGLMQWLCRLVTPKGGLILDPFMGSGSTGMAALAEGFRFIGIEREAEYMEIARKRIAGPLLTQKESEETVSDSL